MRNPIASVSASRLAGRTRRALSCRFARRAAAAAERAGFGQRWAAV